MSNRKFPYKVIGKPIKPRRSVQKLSETQIKILKFLVEKFKDAADGYHTYCSDPQLLKATGKSYRALSTALRKLHGWKLLECSGRSMPVLYWIDPDKVPFVRRVLAGDGVISALLVLNWARTQMGWFTTRDVAKLLNISKRQAQKIVKILVDKRLVIRTHLKGKGYKGRVVYTEAKGQLPLDHFTRSYDTLKNLKWKIYKTQNEFI
jgi:DNA-binding transcriptional regulator GbsR (MarR family)